MQHRRQVVALGELARRIQRAFTRVDGTAERATALLVVRIADLEKIAWRDGKRAARRTERNIERAFQRASHRALRDDDCIGHDRGSDVFAVAMLAAPRANVGPTALDCRAALERIAHAIGCQAEVTVQTGWTFVTQLAQAGSIDCEVGLALERGAREKERYAFFAAVGHELRTPLTSIRGYLETLLDHTLDAQTRRNFTETAQREAMRLGRLLDGMLDFSLLDFSADVVPPETCILDEQIVLACQTIAPLAQRSTIRIEHRPSLPLSVGLSGDRCVQAIVNVLDNAVKYGRRGGLVRVETAIEPPYACIRIDDDGPGLALGEHNSIFNAHVRGARSHGVGRGLGLAIVKAIVERTGGEVEAGQSPLGGARFELWLPLRAENTRVAS